MIPTGRQIREGRALVGMSREDLAGAAGVALGLAIQTESTDGMPMIKRIGSAAIQAALEDAGVEFVPGNGDDARLRLR